eukprot:TRINITY_DN35927_c0_g1_i1.p1 TRINITY_DN35927_c0_g1~~TRINITY_DN35927_c0_g1_i1.p1  ORF type:complete len:217 (+),score=16.45 TRINITY_DN35927_c0_g1_i1:58-651(+)
MTNVHQSKFNYPTTPDMVERYLARGKQASDEMFLEAVSAMVPSLLPSDMQAVATKELDPTMKRSGRPSGKKPSWHEVADYIERSDRIDLPSTFRDALVARLRSGERFTEFDRSKPLHKHLEKSKWQMTIIFLYRHLYNLIDVNEKTVWYEPVGEIAIPTEETRRSKKAMVMAHNVLSGLKMHPPAVPRMFNIMSEIP